MRDLIVPRPVRRGDVVRIIAPAGAFDRTLFWRGVGWLSTHFRVRFERDIFSRHDFFAGDDQRRAAELEAALRCRESRAIIAARGGVGCTRLVAGFPTKALCDHPQWLVGFSDITALHCETARAGVASLHAHNVTGLGRGDADERARWLTALSDPLRQRSVPVRMLTPGAARGPLVGGNLVLLHDMLVGGRWLPPWGSILFVEEIAEPPYRIDRLLSALERAGVFDRVSGLVVGDISASNVGPNGVTPREVFRQLGRRTSLPVAWGCPSGHERRNQPLHLGLPAQLLEGRLTLNPR